MGVWQKFVEVVFRDVLIIGNFGAVPKIVVSWTLLVHHLLQFVLRSGSLTSQKDLKYNKLSRVKKFYWSGVGTVMLFCCWTTPKVDSQSKHVIMLKIQKWPPEVFYVKRCSLKNLQDNTCAKVFFWYWCFPVNFAKFQRTPFYRTPLDNCFSK